MNYIDEENVAVEEDIIEMDESDFTDTPTDENEESIDNGNQEQESNSQQVETAETDEQKLLNVLKSKVRYNGAEVDIKSIDDVVTNYQKGLNYDNLKAKTEKSENAIIDYVNEMARKMNLTPEKYIEKVKAYETERRKAKDEQAIVEMTRNGVPEAVAREVIETRALRESLQREKADFEEQKKKLEDERSKEKEYQEFLEAYPDVDVEKLPLEVFENAEKLKINLTSAYALYENKIIKEKLKQIEQNQKNASSSIVVPTSDGSSTQHQSKDAFLEGFDSVP